MLYIGIDPGKSGAIAWYYENRGLIFGDATVHPCPLKKLVSGKTASDPKAMAALVASIAQKGDEVSAIIEHVHAMPKQGVTSMFTFGTNYGMWLGILAALNVPVKIVSPRTWKKHFFHDAKVDKTASIDAALRRFPGLSGIIGKNHNKAEAILLALYGKSIANDSELGGA